MGKGLSITALVFSILLPIVGFILGLVALFKAKDPGDKKGMAIAAIIISVVWGFIGFFIFIGIFVGFTRSLVEDVQQQQKIDYEQGNVTNYFVTRSGSVSLITKSGFYVYEKDQYTTQILSDDNNIYLSISEIPPEDHNFTSLDDFVIYSEGQVASEFVDDYTIEEYTFGGEPAIEYERVFSTSDPTGIMKTYYILDDGGNVYLASIMMADEGRNEHQFFYDNFETVVSIKVSDESIANLPDSIMY